MTSGSVALGAYALASRALSPLAHPWLKSRVRRGKEDPVRWPERLGHATLARPEGPLVWLHGVSVGESLSLLPLIARIRHERPGWTILVTSGTRASADLLAERLEGDAVHQFAPLDTTGAVSRFLDHWRPDVGVFVESELWPNLLRGAHARGTRLALVSARLSARSARGWTRAPDAARAMLGAFDLILARDGESAECFRKLGARVEGLADLKFGAAPLPVDAADLEKARGEVGPRPVILAASTHEGEEALILEAFRAVRGGSGALLMLAPRHPSRGEAVAALAEAAGLAVTRRGAGGGLAGADVHVADTVGEMGLWYRLAHLSLVGGSLIAGGPGGHNPLEPARLGAPFIAGPYVANWPVYDALKAASATECIAAEGLQAWFARALAAPDTLAPMGERGRAFVAAGDRDAGAAMDRVLALLVP